jgi:hypothetical protein
MAKGGPFVNEDERDPSFGLVSISRVQGSGRLLFESPFDHQHYVTLSIKRAYRHRTDLHDNYIGDGEELIEIALSETQFAAMVTSLNMGVGTPCTIARFGGKLVPEPKPDKTKKTFEKEGKEHWADLARKAAELERLTELPTSSIKAPERERMKFLALKLHQGLTDSAEFFHEQFQKSMDKVVAVAQGEVQAHILSVVQKAGMKVLEGKDPFRLEMSESHPDTEKR